VEAPISTCFDFQKFESWFCSWEQIVCHHGASLFIEYLNTLWKKHFGKDGISPRCGGRKRRKAGVLNTDEQKADAMAIKIHTLK
jgi:hypothetical protein